MVLGLAAVIGFHPVQRDYLISTRPNRPRGGKGLGGGVGFPSRPAGLSHFHEKRRKKGEGEGCWVSIPSSGIISFPPSSRFPRMFGRARVCFHPVQRDYLISTGQAPVVLAPPEPIRFPSRPAGLSHFHRLRPQSKLDEQHLFPSRPAGLSHFHSARRMRNSGSISQFPSRPAGLSHFHRSIWTRWLSWSPSAMVSIPSSGIISFPLTHETEAQRQVYRGFPSRPAGLSHFHRRNCRVSCGADGGGFPSRPAGLSHFHATTAPSK